MKADHRELKADHQELKSRFNNLEKQMAEIYQFTIPRIPRSSNLDQDSGLLRSQGTNLIFNISLRITSKNCPSDYDTDASFSSDSDDEVIDRQQIQNEEF